MSAFHHRARPVLPLVALGLAALSGCAAGVQPAPGGVVDERPPERFTIVPDDYHVPYAGTTEDGHKFFLSDELFDLGTEAGPGKGYVGLYLWNADGSFDEVRVDAVDLPTDVPLGQGGAAGAHELVEARLAELGDYVLEPIEVEPFSQVIDGVTFGWVLDEYEGVYSINVEPGNFIAYYAPWDGLEYDT